MRLPRLSDQAPFTVVATVPGVPPLAFPAHSADVAAEISWGLYDRDPSTEPRWGPSATADGRAWPVAILVLNAGSVHLCLVPAGYALNREIAAGCGRRIAIETARFDGGGRPCPVCLSFWQRAHGQAEREPVTQRAAREQDDGAPDIGRDHIQQGPIPQAHMCSTHSGPPCGSTRTSRDST